MEVQLIKVNQMSPSERVSAICRWHMLENKVGLSHSILRRIHVQLLECRKELDFKTEVILENQDAQVFAITTLDTRLQPLKMKTPIHTFLGYRTKISY